MMRSLTGTARPTSTAWSLPPGTDGCWPPRESPPAATPELRGSVRAGVAPRGRKRPGQTRQPRGRRMTSDKPRSYRLAPAASRVPRGTRQSLPPRRRGATYSHHMKDARFTIPTPNLLTKAVDTLDDLPLDRGDTKGDLYEYMLSKIATAGHNGQFRTPRHIIQFMVEMMNPGPRDEICDPACGTAGLHREAGLRDITQRRARRERDVAAVCRRTRLCWAKRRPKQESC